MSVKSNTAKKGLLSVSICNTKTSAVLFFGFKMRSNSLLNEIFDFTDLLDRRPAH